MEKENKINKLIDEFIFEFNEGLDEKNLVVPELTDEIVKNILLTFFNKESLSEAESYLYHALEDYIDGSYDKIDHDLSYEEQKKTDAYKNWLRFSDIEGVWGHCRRMLRLSEEWANINGKKHTDEEAAKIAADKWCELLFDWHLQDNGALNEDHPGGFTACALGTILANNAKEHITEEMKVKTHELFKEYYKRSIHFYNDYNQEDLNWLKTTLPDKDGNYDWKYGFSDGDMYCDYNPYYPLYLLLVNAGISDNDVRSICPWKTGISIRKEDNAVLYHTYQHREEL